MKISSPPGTGGGSGGGGVNSINSDNSSAQTLSVGSAGADFNITNPGGGAHVFNLPSADTSVRGVVTTGNQNFSGIKAFNGISCLNFWYPAPYSATVMQLSNVSAVMHDQFNVTTIDLTNRTLNNSVGSAVLDYQNQVLSWNYDSINWRTRTLTDNSGIQSILYDSRTLKSGTSTTSLNWNSRLLIDASSIVTIDWGGRTLTDASNATSGNWNTRVLFDTGSGYSIDWSNRVLYDSATSASINWSSRNAFDNLGLLSIDWQNRVLWDPGGVPSSDWSSRLLYDLGGIATVDYGNKTLFDVNGFYSLDWQNRIFVDSLNGVSVDYESRILYDPASFVAVDFNGRSLSDTAGSPQLTWTSTGINLTGIVEKYANATTVAQGVGSILFENISQTQTGTQSFVIGTPAISGIYRVNIAIDTIAAVTGQITVKVKWTNNYIVNERIVILKEDVTTGYGLGACFTVNVIGANDILVIVDDFASIGYTYDFYANIERLK